MSDLIISRFKIVLNLEPIWPAIFLFLNTLPGSWFWPVDPCDLCETETPWEALSPPKLYFFITPANPLPIVLDLTSINLTSLNDSSPISLPVLKSSVFSTLYSLIICWGSVFFFAKKPFIWFVNFEFFIFTKPNLTAEYPFFSLV